MGQQPLTFVRQLMAACANPETLLKTNLYPSDVKERADIILKDCKGYSLGEEVDLLSAENFSLSVK